MSEERDVIWCPSCRKQIFYGFKSEIKPSKHFICPRCKTIIIIAEWKSDNQ